MNINEARRRPMAHVVFRGIKERISRDFLFSRITPRIIFQIKTVIRNYIEQFMLDNRETFCITCLSTIDHVDDLSINIKADQSTIDCQIRCPHCDKVLNKNCKKITGDDLKEYIGSIDNIEIISDLIFFDENQIRREVVSMKTGFFSGKENTDENIKRAILKTVRREARYYKKIWIHSVLIWDETIFIPAENIYITGRASLVRFAHPYSDEGHDTKNRFVGRKLGVKGRFGNKRR